MEAGLALASFGWRAITVLRPQIAAMPTTTALMAMIAARMLALRSKRTCLPRLGFSLAFPSPKISNEKAGWPIADVELRGTLSLNLRVLKQFPVRRGYRGLGGHGSGGSKDRRVERPETERR
jgi:hypothetical protein